MRSSKVQRWLIFGVAASVLPFVLACGYQWIAGAKIKDLIYEYFPDFLLIVLSVAVGVCNSATTVNHPWKKGSLAIAGISFVFCWGLYSWLCGLSSEVVRDRLKIFMITACVMYVLNIFLGVRSEYKLDKEETSQNQETVNQETVEAR